MTIDQILDPDIIPYIVDSTPEDFKKVFNEKTGRNIQSIPELKLAAENYQQTNGWFFFSQNILANLDKGKVNQSIKITGMRDIYQNSKNLIETMKALKEKTKEQIQAAIDAIVDQAPKDASGKPIEIPKAAITIAKFATLEPGPWSPEYIESQSEGLNPQSTANQNKSWSEIINTALGVVGTAAAVAPSVSGAVQSFTNPQGYNQQQIQNQQAQAQIQQQSQQQQNTFLIVVSVIGALLVIGVLWLLLKNKK